MPKQNTNIQVNSVVLLKLHNINFQTDQHINRQKKNDISPKIINDNTKVRIQIAITVALITDDAVAIQSQRHKNTECSK